MNPHFFALRRSGAIALATVLGIALVACSPGEGGTTATEPAGDGGNGGTGTATVSGGTVEITAEDLEFTADTIEAPAGETWTITLVNNDTAPHNISIYTEEGGEEVVVGDVINQGETTEVEVPALDAGEYYFVCDIHPEMNGTLVVGS